MTKSVAKFILETAGARLVGRTFAAGAVGAVGALFQAGAPLALGRAVDLFGHGDANGATIAVFVYVGLLGAARLAPAIATPFTMAVERRLVHAISHKVYAHALDLPYAYHLTRRTGELGRTISEGVNACRHLLSMVLGLLPMAVEIITAAGVLLHLFDAAMLAAYSAFVAVYGVTFALSMKGHRETARRAFEQDGKASNLFVESLLNFESVKAFVAERAVMTRLGELFGEAERIWLRHFSQAARNQIALTIVFTLSFGAIFGLAVLRLRDGGQASDLLIVALYLAQVVRPIEHFTAVWRELIRSSAQVERMLAILSEKTETQLAGDGADLPGEGPLSLRVEGLWHSHHPDHPTLRDVSFTLPRGGTLAVVGPSGGGKSTLVRLLFRFHEPERGAIFVDGVAIEALDLRALRGVLALVPQDCVLFNETLIDNIRFARPEATRAEIDEAMRAAGLDEVVARLPQGEATIVGERGLRLSGGEKQRVAIARALLKRPRLLVLDEATSSLDTRTERLIQERIASVSAGVTRFIVAHRLSTVVDADEIIVLEDGAIVERGAHDALLAADGCYAQMWAAQRREDAEVAEVALEPEPA
ncbi:ABC transporter ATP-binding protein [Methylosinus sp. H3A]|uniref:ATP-binding cassette domain-containing protein n=1 Tax=Methylosinus sp. H3A TaxID=2785786 RepID=UPI0018C2E64C|nr:ABC transporter ATP-binding protein [Methylosinus sp. H3A]MBG0809400.1 ABC transporter ATP-binding protein [Methylosinus sp. H3A]